MKKSKTVSAVLFASFTATLFASDGATRNDQKAIEVLKSFENSGPEAILTWVSKDNFIQHDLSLQPGREGLLQSIKQSKKISVVRTIVDGNYVVLQSDYGDKIGFNVFRFDNGEIVEHWDNFETKQPLNPSGHSMIDGTIEITDRDKTETNKALVKEFVETILMKGEKEKITNYIDANHYIQHNPHVADNLSGLQEALNAMAKKGWTMKYNKPYLILGEGNFVFIAAEGTFAGSEVSFSDIFRVSNGKIVEHWDVIGQLVPKSDRI